VKDELGNAMDNKRRKELQELKIVYFNELTMMGKKYMTDIVTISSMLKLDDQGGSNLTKQQREVHYNSIFETANKYRELIDKKLEAMQQIIAELNQDDNI
jgi:hypothetical protein